MMRTGSTRRPFRSCIDEDKLLVHAADSDCFVSEGEVSLPEFTSVGEETYLLQAANAKDALLDVTLTCEDDFVLIRELSCGPVCPQF